MQRARDDGRMRLHNLLLRIRNRRRASAIQAPAAMNARNAFVIRSEGQPAPRLVSGWESARNTVSHRRCATANGRLPAHPQRKEGAAVRSKIASLSTNRASATGIAMNAKNAASQTSAAMFALNVTDMTCPKNSKSARRKIARSQRLRCATKTNANMKASEMTNAVAKYANAPETRQTSATAMMTAPMNANRSVERWSYASTAA